jgi:hypothetical protein
MRSHPSLLAFMTSICLLLLAATTGGAARAQSSGEITPRFGDVSLTLVGRDFGPGEVVTIAVHLDTGDVNLNVTANDRGRFRLDTGLPVSTSMGLALEATGDQGTELAVMTGVPNLPPSP